VGPLEAAGMEEPAKEVLCFLRLTRAEESADADAGVPRPGVPVVPVAYAAGVLGQGGGGGGHRSSGGGVGEEPEREQAPHHLLAVGDGAVNLLGPCPPAGFVPCNEVPRCRRVHVDQGFAEGQCQDKCQGFSRSDVEGKGTPRLKPEAGARSQGSCQGTPVADDVGPPPHPRQAVVFADPRVEKYRDWHRRPFRGQPPDHDGGGQQLAGHFRDHGLGENEPALPGRPHRFQRRRVLAVFAGNHGGGPCRPCEEPARLRSSQQGTKDGIAVERGSAEPVH
jgi:hypothetical protein